ncbi:dethiobiotin synthase [Floricoccus penangensis]|uniref:dethiobiotin synthase n=1 Tax=Floricoccus penangensis TaxID=1859475 RepID=UPI00204117DC|nr:dethiobiotin synthase [Floricoccus penangensis]URZ88249.1 dethiobiotin synthase [Floricoccus penangensis]
MGKAIFVLGTDTDVGKTFVTGGLTYSLVKNNFDAIPFKPIQSGGLFDVYKEKFIAPDIKFIEEICPFNDKQKEAVKNVYCLDNEVSPHLAARLENVEVSTNEIINHYKRLLENHDYVIVEGAGGIVVPLIEDQYFIYDLIKDLDLDVVIVARAGIGTINHTVLTNEFLKEKNIQARGIIINNYNGEFYEDDNIQMIENLTGLHVIHKFNQLDEFTKENIIDEYEKIDPEKIINLFS